MSGAAVQKGTISTRLVDEALHEWRGRGQDAGALLARAGIQTPLAGGRVSAQAYARLWRALAQAMDDEFFGMNPRRMKVGSFAYMARAASREPTLGAALDSALAFLRLQFDDFAPRLERQGGMAAIVIEAPPGRPGRAFACFTLWMIVHGLACWLAARRIPILAAELRCAAPDYLDDYRVMFSDNLRFARPHNRLLFHAECLEQPARRSEVELRRFLAGAPGNILVRYRDPQSHGARIKAYLRSLEAERWPDFAALAEHCHMAPSTLRRKLAQEGQPYQGLKDQVRRELAIARLDGGAGNFAELAAELGFADTSAFYKAFRKWTGTTPGQYRALMHPEPQPAA